MKSRDRCPQHDTGGPVRHVLLKRILNPGKGQEPDFKCGEYKGNAINSMNSFAIIESPAGERRLHNRVVLTSNVLRKNSACDHQMLAAEIHDIPEETHLVAPDVAVEPGGAVPWPM